jgi:hypothetical protein
MSINSLSNKNAPNVVASASLVRKRKKWTMEMNIFIIREYFRITKLKDVVSTYLQAWLNYKVYKDYQIIMTYTTWAPFPTGLEPVLTSRWWSKQCWFFLPPPYRQPRGDIHTHPWPGGGSFLWKNPPPSVGFEPTSIGTATSEYFLRQPCGHRATFKF